jgi:hypothetical protein
MSAAVHAERRSEATPEPEDCSACQKIDAMVSELIVGPGVVLDQSALSDIRVLRERHAGECRFPRGGAR